MPMQAQELDFVSLGIGGLDRQFEEIFRRAFASRTVPPDLLQRMGQRHVKGMLLYGPPGTGKQGEWIRCGAIGPA